MPSSGPASKDYSILPKTKTQLGIDKKQRRCVPCIATKRRTLCDRKQPCNYCVQTNKADRCRYLNAEQSKNEGDDVDAEGETDDEWEAARGK